MDDDRFYVKTLTLENFRCFEKTELGPFDPHFNLLVGENGNGKSSVLVALANNMRFLRTRGRSRLPRVLLSSSDIRYLAKTGQDGRSSFLRAPAATITAILRSNLADFVVYDEIELQIDGIGLQETDSFRIYQSGSEDKRGIFRDRQAEPILVFYTTDRRFRNIQLSNNSKGVTQRSPFDDWQNAGASIQALREWMKTETLIALQAAKREKQSPEERKQHIFADPLQLVQDALKLVIEGVESIEFVGTEDDIVLNYGGDNRALFSSLSDGQRSIVGLVADLVSRIYMLNGSSLGSQVLFETPGLVLIDELDLHLHPKWQRQIIGALKKIFPKIQFFATTHSPQVIGQAKPEEIVLLTPDGKQERPSLSFGKDSNWVLECIMRAEGRDPSTAAKNKEMLKALDEGRFDDAKRQMEELRDLIGEDSDVAAVDAYLWNLGLDGEKAAQ